MLCLLPCWLKVEDKSTYTVPRYLCLLHGVSITSSISFFSLRHALKFYWMQEETVIFKDTWGSIFSSSRNFLLKAKPLHRSVITLWPVTGNMNIDNLVTKGSESGWHILGSRWTYCPWSWCAESRNNGRPKVFEQLWQSSNCRLGQSISKTATHVGCSLFSVGPTKSGPRRRNWSESWEVKQRHARGEQSVAHVVGYNGSCCKPWCWFRQKCVRTHIASVCSLWGCVVKDRSGGPCWPVSTVKSI